MKEREIVIGHRLGLHARAAARLVQLSTKFQSNIALFRYDTGNPLEADYGALMQISGATGGTFYRAQDADQLSRALARLCGLRVRRAPDSSAAYSREREMANWMIIAANVKVIA